VFADGSVHGLMVLVHGAAGGVGSIATQMAVRDGASVIAVVRPAQMQRAKELGVAHVFASDRPELAAAIRAVAPNGVDRIAEVDLSDHIELDADVIAIGGVISSYYSSADRPTLPYWKLGFADTTLRLLGSDDFAPDVKSHAAGQLTAALVDGSLRSVIAERVPLADIARAHELVEHGVNGRVIVTIADGV
jgi:NADPH:quinone reductase